MLTSILNVPAVYLTLRMLRNLEGIRGIVVRLIMKGRIRMLYHTRLCMRMATLTTRAIVTILIYSLKGRVVRGTLL